MAKMSTLEDLFVDELKDLASVESQMLRTLPTLVQAAGNPGLKKILENHLVQTREHMRRIEQVLKMVNATGSKRCKGIEGIIEEGKDLVQDDLDEHVRDAALIAAAQKAEHYEIATYGTCCTYAKELGHSDAAKLLGQTLDEEKKADEMLTQIAKARVNEQAIAH